jgi:quinohemoprotein ethanol dehydrogenase
MIMGWRSLGWSVGMAALIVAGAGRIIAAPAPAGSEAQLSDHSGGGDWPGYGRTFGEQHYSPLAQINDANVGKLGLAWSIDLGAGSSVTQPLAVNGTLYFAHGYGEIIAVDAASGRRLWKYDANVNAVAGPKMRLSWGMRGIAWWDGRIFFGTVDGRLIAIDTKTGKLAWSAQTTQPGDARYITGAPRVFHDMVIIGHGGGDVGTTRGYVTAYDTRTGKQLWRWYTVPGDPAKGFENEAMEKAAKTWSGEWWKYGGGGTVWNAFCYDPETDTIFFGTGNGESWNDKVRSPQGGDNLYTSSIVALDATTGKYKWHYQINPGESWDYDANMDLELATLTIDGQPRKVIMQAPKDGFFYVIDRLTGKLISAEPFVKVNWASKIDLKTGRPVENPAARYPGGATFVMWPSPLGGHNWLPMAYSPQTRLVYIPTIEKAVAWRDEPDGSNDKPGDDPIRAILNMYPKTDDPRDGTSALIAWDPARQKEAWRWPTSSIAPGGAMATGGNLVFQGSLDGSFRAHAADSGKLLWSFAAQAPVLAPPISYSVNGRQYVSVLTGMGSSIEILGKVLKGKVPDYRSQPKRLLTFVLDGKAKLPALASAGSAPVEDPDFKPDAALEEKGELGFATHCATCHGGFAIAAGGAPDLRRSAIPLSADAFASVVRDGALLANGMPRFSELKDTDLAVIRQYVRARAAALRKGEE